MRLLRIRLYPYVTRLRCVTPRLTFPALRLPVITRFVTTALLRFTRITVITHRTTTPARLLHGCLPYHRFCLPARLPHMPRSRLRFCHTRLRGFTCYDGRWRATLLPVTRLVAVLRLLAVTLHTVIRYVASYPVTRSLDLPLPHVYVVRYCGLVALYGLRLPRAYVCVACRWLTL